MLGGKSVPEFLVAWPTDGLRYATALSFRGVAAMGRLPNARDVNFCRTPTFDGFHEGGVTS